ncbi:MAG: hypothetical protein E7265_02060 [Lachnospiraceae bacterium]|nr:hypothetical protein [Lachnospiraceae bacterium]
MRKVINNIKKTIAITTLSAMAICTVITTAEAKTVRYSNCVLSVDGSKIKRDATYSYSHTVVSGCIASNGVPASVNAGASMIENGYYVVKTGLGKAISNSGASRNTVAWHSYNVASPNDTSGTNRWFQN